MKLLRYILKATVVATLLVCLFSLYLFSQPRIVMNEAVLKMIANIAEMKGVKVHWKTLKIEAESISFFRKKISLDADSICISLSHEDLQGCVAGLHFSVAVRLSARGIKIIDWSSIEVTELNWTWVADQRKTVGLFTAFGVRPFSGGLKESSSVGLRIQSETNFPDGTLLSLRGDLKIGHDFFKNFTFHYDLDGLLKISGKNWFANLSGRGDRNYLIAQITGHGLGGALNKPEISVDHCNLRLSRMNSGAHSSGQIEIVCPTHLVIPISSQVVLAEQIPKKVDPIVYASLNASDFYLTSKTHLAGRIQVRLNPLVTSVLQTNGNLDIQLSDAELGQSPLLWRAKFKMFLTVLVPQFHKLVDELKEEPIAVPAPFHVLRGSLKVEIQGEGELASPSNTRSKFPFQFNGQLFSNSQTVKMAGEGNFIPVIENKLELNLNIHLLLSDTQLELPVLDLAVPPRFVSDSRLQSFQRKVEVQNDIIFRYNVRIQTAPGHPALLISNLVKSKIPLSIDVSFSDSKPLSGRVKLETFPVEVFHRKADIDFLQMSLRSPLDESLVFGTIETSYANYKIMIDLGATYAHPQIQLRSEPPLPENQIVSVLIYGRPLEDLSTSESTSVGSARAAFADQALGLASLYVLASTPIESLSYDPTTNIVSARLKLGEGTSLNLGTNAKETTTIGVQKTLGKNWTLQTDFGSSETSKGVASAYLQWSNRY